MVNSLKRLNWIQVICLISLVVSYILYCFNVKSSEYLFWFFLGLTIFGNVKFIDKWSKEGKTGNRRMDMNYDKNLTRKTSEYIFIVVVAYVLVMCLTVVASIWIKGFMYESSTLFAMLASTIVWTFALLLAVERTSNEVEQILKGGKKNGNK